MGKPMADYVKLPEFDEYKEWFRDFADLKREDGIVQVTWKTLDGPMHHSGMSHRAMSQLTRWLSLDFKNEIIIYTHIGDNWMIESDANGWETYSELPTQRFQHQYFDDTNLIKNMVFDLDVPTIGAIPGPGFHWDSAMLCDITLCSEDTKMEVPHAQGGLVPGDGMGLMCQHYFGTKRGNYYMMTSASSPPGRCWSGAWSTRCCPRARCWSGPGRSPACGRRCPMRTAPSCPTWPSGR